ncbi:MAG: hypothetical protein PWP11_774 [Thauera sp.]|nr:phage major capsid protein [Thauera sp.]MDI3489497.1 hypothetical protein [Thauera sp.]
MTMHTPFRRVPSFGAFPAPSAPAPQRMAGQIDPDFRLRALAAQINVLDVLRYQAGISRDAIDIGPAVEYTQEIASRSGRPANGLYVPHAALLGANTRAMTVGTASAGGHTVATNLLASRMIDLLRPRSRVIGAGAMVLTGLQGNVAIPRQTAAASAYWVPENTDITAPSQPAVDQVTLTPKTVGAYTEISRKLLLQSSIGVADFVSSDLLAVLGLAVDAAAIAGTGGGQPTGLLSTSGVQSQTIAGAKPTWAEIVGMGTKIGIATDNAARAAFMVTSKTRGDLMQTEKSTGSGVYIWESDRLDNSDGTIGGLRAMVSNNLPMTLGTGSDEHALLCGIWSDLIIGMWGDVDLLLDPYSKSTSGALRITAFQDVDVAVRHADSFVKAQYAPA